MGRGYQSGSLNTKLKAETIMASSHTQPRAARQNSSSRRQKSNRSTEKAKVAKQLVQMEEQLLNSNLQLVHSRAMLQEVMDSINHGVIALDLQGRVTIFNQAAAYMSGIVPEEAIGVPYLELKLHPAGAEEKSPLMQTLATGTRIVDGERYLPVINSNAKLPIRYFTSLLRDANGATTGAVEVFEDLSEIKLLEDRVSRGRTLAALGEMAANVAHELRNPLGGIGGYAAMLYEILEDNPDARHYVQKLIEGVDSLNRVATNLLAFTRPVEPRYYRGDLRSVVKEVLDYVAIEIEQSDSTIQLQSRFSRQPLAMELDSELLRQAFLNLLKNAVQAVDSSSGLIKVQVGRLKEEGIYRVEIRDNGHGVVPEQQEKLFNPFHTTRNRGTGLGLPIARKNIELHDGNVSFRNNRNGGATFRVDFQIAKEIAVDEQ